MAELQYRRLTLTIHIIANPEKTPLQPNTNSGIWVRSGERFDVRIEEKELAGKESARCWWTMPVWDSNFRGSFETFTVDDPVSDEIRVSGTTILGANANVPIYIHVMHS